MFSSSLYRVVAVIAVSLIGLLACSEKDSVTNSVPEVVKAVKTYTVESQDGYRERVFSGTTISADEQSLSFRASGVITQLSIKIGDVLKRGDIIAKLDNTDFDITVRQSQASVAQARADQINTKSYYDRAKSLYAAQAMSLADLESAQANADSAKANLRVAQQKLNAAIKNQEYTTLISASDNCKVTEIPTSLNTTINSGSPVVKLSCGSFLRAKVTIPEVLIDKVNLGEQVSVSLPSIQSKIFAGTIVEIGVSNNDAAGYDIEIDLKESDKNLRVGLVASVILRLNNEVSDQTILLPPQAVLQDNNGKFVYILGETEIEGVFIAQRKNIATGKLYNGGVEVLNGLSENNEIIISGVSQLIENMKVKRLSLSE